MYSGSFLKKPLLLILFFTFLDQLTKYFAVTLLRNENSIDVLPFLAFTYVQNQGISFGLLQNLGNGIFLALNITLVIGLIAYLYAHRAKLAKWPWRALLLIVAGGAGNVLDRCFRGFVVDFIDFKVWPVFNLADAMITIGIIIYVSHTAFHRSNNT